MAGRGGDDGDLKLQGPWASPHVLRVRLALGLKGVSYEYVEEEQDLGKDDRTMSELLLHSTRPVLVHGGEPVRGTSSNLVQYVDEAFPGPSLLPDDPSRRAAARYLAAVIDDTLIKAMYEASWGKTDGERAEGKKQVAAAVETLERALRDQCTKPFFGGNTVEYVDVVLGGLLPWVRATDATRGAKTFDPATAPLLAAWTSRFGALETVGAIMPEVAKLVRFFSTVVPARRSGRWSSYGVYCFWLFISLFLPRVREWWQTNLLGWDVELEAQAIPRVIALVLAVAFAVWFQERCPIGVVVLGAVWLGLFLAFGL